MFKIITLLTIIQISCMRVPNNKFTIDNAQVDSILIKQKDGYQEVNQQIVKDQNKIKEFVNHVNNNKQHLTKFLPTYEVTVYYKNDSSSVILFRDNYFKTSGTYKMKRNIEDILRNVTEQ